MRKRKMTKRRHSAHSKSMRRAKMKLKHFGMQITLLKMPRVNSVNYFCFLRKATGIEICIQSALDIRERNIVCIAAGGVHSTLTQQIILIFHEIQAANNNAPRAKQSPLRTKNLQRKFLPIS
jgi:hypothetical protein